MKPGYKTTEFWLTLVVAVLTAVLPFVVSMPAIYKVVSVALAVMAAMGYTAARTSVKNNQPSPPNLGE